VEIPSAGRRSLKTLAKLSDVSLSDCRVNDEGLACLLQLPQLRHLSVTTSTVTGHNLDELTCEAGATIVDIGLFSSEVDDAGLMEFANIPSLRRLDIRQSKVTAEGLDQFRKARPMVAVQGP